MAMYTREIPTMGALAYQHKDPSLNFGFENITTPIEMPLEAGQFRELNERANFLEREFAMSKLTAPQSLTFGDSLRSFQITPIAGAFEFSNVDLGQPSMYGKTSKAEMIAEQQGILALQMKKYKEKLLYTAVTTDANFESSSYYNDAAVVWSNVGVANMTDDIRAGKLVLGGGPYRLTMSNTAAEYAYDNATLKASTVVSGSGRDGTVDPNPTAEFLRRYFGVSEVVITAGELITDSGDPTDATKAEIWGDSALLERIGNPSLMQPSWCKQLFFAPLGRGKGSGGWFTLQTGDAEVGGVGTEKYATWNYFSYLIQEKTMAYRIDNLY